MAGEVLRPADFGSPTAVAAVLDSDNDLQVELGTSGPQEMSLLQIGELHQILTTVRRQRRRVIVAVPHHDGIESTSMVFSTNRERVIALHAHAIIGKGRRDLTGEAKAAVRASAAQRERLFVADNDALSSESSNDRMFSVAPEGVRLAAGAALREVGLSLPAIADDPILPPLATFLKEAIDNVRHHAVRAIADNSIMDGFSLVAIRRIDFAQAKARAFDSDTSATWARGLEHLLSDAVTPTTALIEVSIGDSGEGVPATFRESVDVYSQPFTLELHAIEQALSPRGTRPNTRPSVAPRSRRGFGFSQMLEALCALKGHLRLRAGRTDLSWTSVDENGVVMPAEAATKSTFTWDRRERSFLAGTSVSFVFPVDVAQPLQTHSLFDIAEA